MEAPSQKKYNGELMALALRMGVELFGLPRSIYSDWGKPETGKRISNLIQDLGSLQIEINETLDVSINPAPADPEEMRCDLVSPGQHRRAIVRNAKAKMIESTFRVLEAILRNHLLVPGYCKRLGDAPEQQEVDQKEAQALAAAGKLLTFREFMAAFYRALDYYNNERPHRGVLREWVWQPKPKETTPYDCLQMCISQDGWQPRYISDDVAEFIFLPKEERCVNNGQIQFRNKFFRHDKLVTRHGQRVQFRYNPLYLKELLVFQGDEFLCCALPVEYSSMKDRDLATRKIREKRRLQRYFMEQYKELTRGVPDVRNFSTVSSAERAAALIGDEKRRRVAERNELYRLRTQEEFEAEAAQIREYKLPEIRPERVKREFFKDEIERYDYLLDELAAGGKLSPDDYGFMQRFEAGMAPDVARYWAYAKEVKGITDVSMGKCNSAEGAK